MAAPDVPEAAVSDAEAARFRATGVLHKPRFFTGEEAAAMRRCVETLQRRGLMGNILRDAQTENLQMAWLSHHSRLFQVLPWEGRVAAALRRLLPSDDVDAGVEVHYDQLFLKPALTGAGTAWHADQAYFKLRRPERGLDPGSSCTTAPSPTELCTPRPGGRASPISPTDRTRSSTGTSSRWTARRSRSPPPRRRSCRPEGSASSDTAFPTAPCRTQPPTLVARWRTTSWTRPRWTRGWV